MAGMEKSAAPIFEVRRSGPEANEPRPATRPSATTVNAPPSESPASRAASMASSMAALAAALGARQLPSSTASQEKPSPASAFTLPMRFTKERTCTPMAKRNALAMPPAATRAAVSRALERSRMLRASSVPIFNMPVRSACPGRGCTSRTRSSGRAPNTSMRPAQFSWSAFSTTRVMGVPSVVEKRRPEVTRTVSVSMRCRPPRP